MTDATFTMTKKAEFDALCDSDREFIKNWLSLLTSGKEVVCIRLWEEWHNGRSILNLQNCCYMSYKDERTYLDNGGSWHYVDPASMRYLLAGKL